MKTYYECDWCGWSSTKDATEKHEPICPENPKNKNLIVERIKDCYYDCDEETVKKMSREDLEHIVLRIVNHPLRKYGISEDDLADIVKGNHTTLQWSDGKDR